MQFSQEERTPFSKKPAAFRLGGVDLSMEDDPASFDWLIRAELNDMPNDFDAGLNALCSNPTLSRCPALLRRIAKHTRYEKALRILATRDDIPLFPDVVATLRERSSARDSLFENAALRPFIELAGGSLEFETISESAWGAISSSRLIHPPHSPTPQKTTLAHEAMRAYFGSSSPQ